MSKARFRPFPPCPSAIVVGACGEAGEEADPFGIADPGMLRSRYQTPILTTVFQLSFLSVYFISSPVGLLGDEIVSFRFRKSIDARAKIAVKYMCMRNYVVTTPGATLRGFNVNAAAIFNVSLSSLIKCPRLITCNLTLNVVTKHFAIHFFFFFLRRVMKSQHSLIIIRDQIMSRKYELLQHTRRFPANHH